MTIRRSTLILILASIAVLGTAMSVQARSGSLPLRRGVYGDANLGCHGAPSAAKLWFGGGYIVQAPHARCVMRALAHPSANVYVVTKRCHDDTDPTSPFDLVDRVTIVSHTAFDLTNANGRFALQWCRG